MQDDLNIRSAGWPFVEWIAAAFAASAIASCGGPTRHTPLEEGHPRAAPSAIKNDSIPAGSVVSGHVVEQGAWCNQHIVPPGGWEHDRPGKRTPLRFMKAHRAERDGPIIVDSNHNSNLKVVADRRGAFEIQLLPGLYCVRSSRSESDKRCDAELFVSNDPITDLLVIVSLGCVPG